ncbi:hypothetical protein [Bradyrhizobium sp. Ec3.3]|nr:hypothetical protein [Bradyrhizobium sp. Ec3.3]
MKLILSGELILISFDYLGRAAARQAQVASFSKRERAGGCYST